MGDSGLELRMKRYEKNGALHLTRRAPVIVRVDGRAFHTFLRKADRPFDENHMVRMQYAASMLLDEMQGGRIAYVQSDEASFLLVDYDRVESEPWFDYDLQKIVSLSASIMSVEYNRGILVGSPLANFDARAFTVPREDVANYFLWRARDWNRNSIQLVAQFYFSHKQLHKKSLADIHDLLHTVGVNWARDFTQAQKNGVFVVKGGERVTDILPNWMSVSGFVEPFLQPKGEDSDATA